MANLAQNGERGRVSLWRIAGWGTGALILLLPLIAMQFTNEVKWDETDFIFAGILVGGVGAAVEFTVRKSRNGAYRAAVAFALAVTSLTLWANAAVGMIGNEDNPMNFMFFGVLALALAGAIVARFRPAGMARAMGVAAVAQILVAGIGAFTDPRGGVFSALFTLFWIASALLFGRAAREEHSVGSAARA